MPQGSPQGSSASPGWFVKDINEVINSLEQVAAYLDDVVFFDSDPTAHVKTMWADLFKRIRPIASLLRKVVKFEFTPAIEVIVREILTELAANFSLPRQGRRGRRFHLTRVLRRVLGWFWRCTRTEAAG